MNRPTSRKPALPALVIVTAILQLVFGTFSTCGPAMALLGVPEMMAAWQDSFQAKLPQPKGQPQISQTKIMKMIEDRMPGGKAYQYGAQGASILLSTMMIAGGIGLLLRKRWAWQLTLAWGLLSILYTIALAVINIVYIGPATIEAMKQVFAELPAPPPGQPDMRPTMEALIQVGVSVGAYFALLGLLYPGLILVLVTRPSVKEAFRSHRETPDETTGEPLNVIPVPPENHGIRE